MKFFTKRVQGSISLFLVMIMLPMFVLAGLIVDGARLSAARVAVSGAGDLAMSAALSEYDKVLHDVYGLFAMSENMEDLQKNVNRYFNNTINNTGNLAASDSYTRSFFNSIGGMFSNDDISFDNIVDTEVESFDMITVSNSALANPTVLERQIVEYMKVRGPVNLGTTLLTKLGCMGETSKQNKAVKAKVEYDKKLKSVQDACQEAYTRINNFNNQVIASKYNGANYLSDINSALATSKDKTERMVKRIIAYKMKLYEVKEMKTNNSYKTDVYDYFHASDSETVVATRNMNRYNSMYGLLYNRYVRCHENTSNHTWSLDSSTNGERISSWYFAPGSFSSTDDDDAWFNGLRTRIVSMNVSYHYDVDAEIYTIAPFYTDAYNGLTEDQTSADNGKIAKVYSLLSSVAYNAKTTRDLAATSREDWDDEADMFGEEACKALCTDWYDPVSGFVTELEAAISALETVKEKAQELRDAKTDWRNKLDNLSDSDIKTSMEGDYANCAQQINETVVNTLITKLTNDKDHFNSIKTKLESVKFNGQQIIIANCGDVNFYNKFKNKVTSSSDATEFDSEVSTQMSTHYQGVTDISAGLTPSSFSVITTDSDQFYKFLANTCGNNAESSNKEAATNQRDTLVSNANAASTPPSTDGMTTGNYVGDTGLSTEISNAIDQLAAAGVCDNTFDATEIPAGGSDDDMATGAGNNLSDIASLLDGLADIAGNVRDSVYLEEYFTEMFSCFTTGVGDGNPPTKSLSNVDMSNNKFFRSEAEYILWGFDSVDGNIAATFGLIFGIRFALNAVYAFTNSFTRSTALTAATAIAGWTGFGVPIVQTVILLAWALAESAVDIAFLAMGKDVVIYKTSSTWVTSPEGAAGALEELVGPVVDCVFDKIQDVADDAIDTVAGDIEQFANDTIEDVKESIKSSVSNSIQTLIISVVGESNYNLTQDDIETRITQMIDSLEETAGGSDSNSAAISAAIGVLRDKKGVLASKLYGYYTDAKEGITHAVDEILDDVMSPIAEQLEAKVSEALSGLADNLKGKVNEIISAGGDKVKENLNGAIDGFLGDLGGGGETATTGTSSSVASKLTLNYKEYVKIFILLNMLGNETHMLNRCAKLIQINVSQQNTSFNIAEAYTMAQINSTVSIRTTFFDVPVNAGVDAGGNAVYDLDFSNIGTGRQRISYVGILGY